MGRIGAGPGLIPHEYVRVEGLGVVRAASSCLLSAQELSTCMSTSFSASSHAHDHAVAAYESISRRMNGFLYRCRNDAAYTMLVMSGQVRETLGYHKEELLMNRRVSFVSLIHPEDAPAVDAAVAAGVEARENWDVDYRLQRADGAFVWVNEHGGPVFNADGQLAYLEGVIVNISVRKQEEKARAAQMERIGKASNAILNATTDILDVLQMLKIISLNAKIEASRAGVHGRSFTVVADQVQRLADETSLSAGKVTKLIENLSAELRG